MGQWTVTTELHPTVRWLFCLFRSEPTWFCKLLQCGNACKSSWWQVRWSRSGSIIRSRVMRNVKLIWGQSVMKSSERRRSTSNWSGRVFSSSEDRRGEDWLTFSLSLHHSMSLGLSRSNDFIISVLVFLAPLHSYLSLPSLHAEKHWLQFLCKSIWKSPPHVDGLHCSGFSLRWMGFRSEPVLYRAALFTGTLSYSNRKCSSQTVV